MDVKATVEKFSFLLGNRCRRSGCLAIPVFLSSFSLQIAEGRHLCLCGLTAHVVSGKPQHSTLKQSRQSRQLTLHFPQMMQVATVFAAEHRKGAGDLRLRLFIVLLVTRAVPVL